MNKNTEKEEEKSRCRDCGLSLSSDYFKTLEYKEKGCPECGGKEYESEEESHGIVRPIVMKGPCFGGMSSSQRTNIKQYEAILKHDKEIQKLKEKIKQKNKYIKELETKLEENEEAAKEAKYREKLKEIGLGTDDEPEEMGIISCFGQNSARNKIRKEEELF